MQQDPWSPKPDLNLQIAGSGSLFHFLLNQKKSKYTSLFRFSEDSHVDLFFDVTLLHHYWSYCVLCLSRKVVLCGCFFLCIFSLVDHWITGRKYWPTTDGWTFCHNLHALSTHRHSIYIRTVSSLCMTGLN